MSAQTMPSPETFFDNVWAFQRTAALKAAVELDLFTAIGEGGNAAEIATRAGASERGVRLLSDFLTVIGFLTKTGDRYALTPDSAFFLVKTSPAYLGGTLQFLASPLFTKTFDHLASTVRRGTVASDSNMVADDHPIWADFARAMVPMMMPNAQAIADVLQIAAAPRPRVLDIAAGHGMFGIVLAQRNPAAEVVAVDWAHVLTVASANAKAMGVGGRHRALVGDAFKVDYGSGFDVALVTNFLHHFDRATCVTLLRKVAAALGPGGRVVVLEFVPNEDRVTPHAAAGFVVNMLAGTAHGDVYTFNDLQGMLKEAGFSGATAHAMPTPETAVVATKA